MREAIRPSLMNEAREQLCQTYGKHFDAYIADVVEKDTRTSLGEKLEEQTSIIEQLHENVKQVSRPKDTATHHEPER